MKRLARKGRKGIALFAVTAAALGTALLPATGAQADDPLPCFKIVGICTWTGTNGNGTLAAHFTDEPFVTASFHSAQNQTSDPWCLYDKPLFTGKTRALGAGKTVRDIGFGAESLRKGHC